MTLKIRELTNNGLDMINDGENLDKSELFDMFKEGEGSEYALAIRKNVVSIILVI